MNWRKGAASLLLKVCGGNIDDYLSQIKALEFAGIDQINALRDDKLEQLVAYCYRNVPYYRSVLEKAEVCVGSTVKLENYGRIPPLTKQTIRENFTDLIPVGYSGKGRYENTSGGSTGEPVKFYQDKRYESWNTANKLYFNSVLGKQPGDKEIKLWGSDRDILQGNLTAKDRLINFFYNRRFFNCYELSDARLEELRLVNNSFKPVGYWSYMEAALELAEYIARTGKLFYPPKLIISTIAPLTEQIRNTIETNLGCDVYNQYGSREVGAIGCECREKDGLHTFPWSHFVEVADENGQTLQQGSQGQVLVTPLENYAMPMLRYAIGDAAISGSQSCGCGRNTFKLKEVIGRTLGYFVKPDGSLAHSHFIVQALFFKDWIERFQIIQDDISHITIMIQKKYGSTVNDSDVEQIKDKCRVIMGQDCKIDFDYVECIEPSASGKFVYTICKVARK